MHPCISFPSILAAASQVAAESSTDRRYKIPNRANFRTDKEDPNRCTAAQHKAPSRTSWLRKSTHPQKPGGPYRGCGPASRHHKTACKRATRTKGPQCMVREAHLAARRAAFPRAILRKASRQQNPGARRFGFESAAWAARSPRASPTPPNHGRCNPEALSNPSGTAWFALSLRCKPCLRTCSPRRSSDASRKAAMCTTAQTTEPTLRTGNPEAGSPEHMEHFPSTPRG
mmetsp:Transcript_139273/g.445227  ORF Transcript_139273/g.445227 Transcript_139273/m.445227 type:complete len:229 (+) Transcript_139273:1803-2489(+)